MFTEILIYQAGIYLSEYAERKRVYGEAYNYAKAINKPLLVVGGPYGGNIIHKIFGFMPHGAGDICIDTDPSACGNSNFLQADIRNIPLPDKYAGAVFCSHVIEHLPSREDAILALRELVRISDAQFVLVPSKLNIRAWLHADHKLWIYENEGQLIIEERR
jgi:hypothetical protein